MQDNPNYKRVAKWIKLLCGSLFAVFSFCYLYFLQAELIGRAQHILSGGTTTYAPLLGALVLTFVALLLAAGIDKVLKLPIRFVALAYFPSMGLLGWLTDITPMMTVSGMSLGLSNYWVFGVLLILWAAIVFVAKQFPDVQTQHVSFISAFWTNCVLVCSLSLSVILLGNTDENLHARLQAERCLSRNDYQQLLRVSRKNMHVSKSLTAMRALALAHEGQMGESLFTFPQDFASQGLIVADSDLLDYDTLQVYFNWYWNAVPVGNIQQNPLLFFTKLLERPNCDTLTIRDYYLCSLLLDRRVDLFVTRLPVFYPTDSLLPLHYREALVLGKHLYPDHVPDSIDTRDEERFADFESRVAACPDAERKNYARRNFGDTYWYYYLYAAD